MTKLNSRCFKLYRDQSLFSIKVSCWWSRLSFRRLQIQLWLQISCYVTSTASIVKQYTHVWWFRIVLIKGNTLCFLKKNCSFVSSSVRCSRVVNIPFRLVALLFAAVTRWKRPANWWMMAALWRQTFSFWHELKIWPEARHFKHLLSFIKISLRWTGFWTFSQKAE